MYEFIVKYQNMDTLEEVQRKIEVDTTPLDAECMGHQPEILYAWKMAANLAYNLKEHGQDISSIELLSC